MAYNACMAGPCLTLFTSLPPSIRFIHCISTTQAICSSANPGEKLWFEQPRKTSSWAHTQTGRLTTASFLQSKKNWKQMSIKTAWQKNYSLFIPWAILSRSFFQTFFFFTTKLSKKYFIYRPWQRDLDNTLIDPSPWTQTTFVTGLITEYNRNDVIWLLRLKS